jgi:hypothetical protein
MTNKTPLFPCLIAALWIAIITQGVGHPAIGFTLIVDAQPLRPDESVTVGASCGWMLWHNKAGVLGTCSTETGACTHVEWSKAARLLVPKESYESEEECQTAVDATTDLLEDREQTRKTYALGQGYKYYIILVYRDKPQCWPVGHNPNDENR